VVNRAGTDVVEAVRAEVTRVRRWIQCRSKCSANVLSVMRKVSRVHRQSASKSSARYHSAEANRVHASRVQRKPRALLEGK
ncbi:ATP synthase B chain, partial [Trichinella spiralis]|uniref:ATP synthase B chain n=1 Tax=Trichinella spiralis TaxID=6334 RepID=UPI0001EFB9FD